MGRNLHPPRVAGVLGLAPHLVFAVQLGFVPRLSLRRQVSVDCADGRRLQDGQDRVLKSSTTLPMNQGFTRTCTKLWVPGAFSTSRVLPRLPPFPGPTP